MTLPAIGVIGLTFLCLILVVGIAVLVLVANPDLRYRLCEALSSYRSEPKEKPKKKKKKHKEQPNFNDMFGVSQPHHTEMYPPASGPHPHHQQQDQYPGNGGNPYSQQDLRSGNPYVAPQRQTIHNVYSGAPKPHTNHQSHHHGNNQRVSAISGQSIDYANDKLPPKQVGMNQQYPGYPEVQVYSNPRGYTLPEHNKPRTASHPEQMFYPGSSGTSSPYDSAMGTSENSSRTGGKHGILKQPSANLDKSGKHSSHGNKRPKSVGIEDSIQTIEISR